MGENHSMSSREEQVYREAAALWRQVFGEPPPIRADGTTMLDIIMHSLPEETYDRLRTPHIRPNAVVLPNLALTPR